jgi:glycosyltransferase involved in cell wall biosynthesis
MKVAILSPYPTFPFHDQLGCLSTSHENNATWTVALANHLAKLEDTEVHVITEVDDISCSKTIFCDGVNLHFISAPSKYKTLTLWWFDRSRLLRVLATIRPDIVHGQGMENQYGLVAVRSKWPHLLTIHGIPRLSNDSRNRGLFERERIVEALAAFCLKSARQIVVINPFVAECLGLSEERYRLFPIANALSRQFFEAEPRTREPDLILAIGSVDRLKAHDVLLRAMALLRQRRVPARIVIAGPIIESAYLNALRLFIHEEKLEVQFTDFLPPEEIRSLLQRCTVLVHPSRHESSPMSVCEAMALGTPVVGARVGGIPYIIRDQVTGLLFQSGNASELADKIQYLLENESARCQLGEAGRKYALETHHPDRVAQLTRAAYEQILKGKR